MKHLTLNRRNLLTAISGLAAASVAPAAANVAMPRIIESIIDIAAGSEGLTSADILGPVREKPFIRARQRAMYLARQATDRSLPELGRRFGGRDHTTILHALRKISGLVEHDDSERQAIEILRRAIERRTGFSIPNRAVTPRAWRPSPYDDLLYPRFRDPYGIGL
ncbi:helix-turn-helix domain-containing protein [uncultured Hyphomicrobium sp.]|jgi:hypothetical protein|uniref:helix-turn-helix domain-containing protein n=1 Tax=uncultured Hyphomicrobium sp. TaxID=194373 RepID=UPI0025ED0908|nr:helix-turn-helix domain-containing protein [uncultured Hyphomicrobium sp.]